LANTAGSWLSETAKLTLRYMAVGATFGVCGLAYGFFAVNGLESRPLMIALFVAAFASSLFVWRATERTVAEVTVTSVTTEPINFVILEGAADIAVAKLMLPEEAVLVTTDAFQFIRVKMAPAERGWKISYGARTRWRSGAQERWTPVRSNERVSRVFQPRPTSVRDLQELH